MDVRLFPVVAKLHDRLLQVLPQKPGRALASRKSLQATRQIIKGISQRSRNRLIRFLSTINRPDPGWFVTLTYRHWIDDFQLWKRHLNRFLTALRWRYASSTGVWRLEFQSRGAPHFHLLLWLGREESRLALHSWARDRWLATIEDSSAASRKHAVTAEEIRDFRNCGFYLSLYQTKDKQDRKDIPTGREWGKIQPKLLCTEPIRQIALSPDQVRLLRRTIRRAHRARNRSTYRRSTYWRSLGVGERGFSMCLPFYEQTRLLDWLIKSNPAPAVVCPSFR